MNNATNGFKKHKENDKTIYLSFHKTRKPWFVWTESPYSHNKIYYPRKNNHKNKGRNNVEAKKLLTATCFFMEDHEAKETNKAVVEEPMYAPISVAAAPSNGKIFSNKAVITIMVIAELDWVMTAPISPISINHHQWKSVYCDKSILALKNFILSFIYSNHKNTNHKAISIKNHLRYFLEKNAPS